VCRSYSDLNFGVTFFEHSVYIHTRDKYNVEGCQKALDIQAGHL